MSIRRSTRKRHFPLSLSKKKNDEVDFDYDGTKNLIYELEGYLKQIRKKLKPVKQTAGKKVIPEIGPIQEIMRDNVHSNIRALNDSFFVNYEEGLKLKQQIEEIQHKLLKANDNLDKKDMDLHYLEEKLSQAESNRKKLESECSELKTQLGIVTVDDSGISQLPDDNNQTVISDNFTQIYDKNWKCSMDDLGDLGLEEDKCAEILLQILTDSYEECGKTVEKMNKHLKNAIMITECEDETKQLDETILSLPKEVMQPVLDFRRTNIDESVVALQKISQAVEYLCTVQLKTYQIPSPEHEETDIEYDAVKNSLTKLENGCNWLRNLLKSAKEGRCGTNKSKLDIQIISEHVRKHLHSNMQSINELLNVDYEAVLTLKQQLNRKEKQLNSLNEKLTTTESQRKIIESKCSELNSRILLLESKLDESKEKLEGKQNGLKEENKQILQQMETQLKEREDKIKSLNANLQRQSDIFQKQAEEINEKNDEEVARLQNDISSMENIIQQLQNERQTLEKEQQHKDEALTSFQNDLFRKENLIRQLQKQKDHERKAKEEERQHKDEALTRLSAIAGDRLRNNNPGIPDLCDPNRPIKIAEKFTEMYDNDWTDNMEALEDLGLGEEKCVEILLHFVTDSYEECGQIVDELNNNLKKTVMVAMCDGETNQSEESDESSQDLPAEITKPILDLRRKLTDKNIETLTKKLPEHLKKKRNLTEEQMSACHNFIRDCIKYTWMMQIQDPPVHIEWAFPRESDIDSNLLRSYTKAGEKVDYIVWPVLYLHKGGAVLNKGVVHPFPHMHNDN